MRLNSACLNTKTNATGVTDGISLFTDGVSLIVAGTTVCAAVDDSDEFRGLDDTGNRNGGLCAIGAGGNRSGR
jgi:hypothetical protein